MKKNIEQKDSDIQGQSQADDLALRMDQEEEVADWDSEEYNPGKRKVKIHIKTIYDTLI